MVVVILPDGGRAYLSKIFNDGWMMQHGFLSNTGEKSVGDLWIAKEPIIKDLLKKRFAMPLFWERAVIEITPRRVLLWGTGQTTSPPQVFGSGAAA